MKNNATFLSYQQTGFFSKLVSDYLSADEQLKSFYNYPVNIDGIKAVIKARQSFATNRDLLVNELTNQYHNIPFSIKQAANLNSLISNKTFTISTAHQPNIFMGPLYFIYKIIHVIKLADELKIQLPEYDFVPVFYMGSEDADLDELGYINLGGEKLVWQTKQTGAVGRMLVDKPLLQMISSVEGQVGVHPFGNELVALFKQCYTIGKTIQQATLELVNALFASYGLLIVVPDNANLKASFNSVVVKELTEQFSHKAVAETIKNLSQHYKVQAGGRDLNLFYLIDDKRERIEVSSSKFQLSSSEKQVPNFKFQVQNLGLEFSEEEILKELQNYPERFSANVILRGVFQETILPNIAFIGGGGELAYWLELKQVFEAVNVPYPMLVLRNSFLLIQQSQIEKIQKLAFEITDFFKNELDLVNDLVQKKSTKQLSLVNEIKEVNIFYDNLKNTTALINNTLAQHTESLQTKALKPLYELEKKMLRAEKRHFTDQQLQIQKLKSNLFPNNSLQERIENFSTYYAKYGKDWLQLIYNQSKGLQQEFGIVKLP